MVQVKRCRLGGSCPLSQRIPTAGQPNEKSPRSGKAFERTVLSDKKLAALPRFLPQDGTGVFKDTRCIRRGV